MVGRIMRVPTTVQDLGRYNISTNSGGGGTATTIGTVKVVNTTASMYAIPSADQVQWMQVYDKETGRTYILENLPASTPANWIIKGDGDSEDSYSAAVGNFDPLTATKRCGTNQTINASTLPIKKMYKIIATADIRITFNLPIIASSPMINGMAWNLRAGDELSFYKTEDGLSIDGDVK